MMAAARSAREPDNTLGADLALVEHSVPRISYSRMLYKVGIRFSPIGDSSKTEESIITKKHWALVFSPGTAPTGSRQIELLKGDGGAVAMITTEVDFGLPAHPLATYEGNLSDMDRILEVHPMRRSLYSACFNNCQHFTATFLLLLKAFANERYTVTHPRRMATVQEVLARQEDKLYHLPNIYLQIAQMTSVSVMGMTFAATAVAAEATVTSIVPAAGLWGWFGATTTVVAPAAYAALAGTIAPVAAATTVVSAAGYAWRVHTWKARTLFDNPSPSGFPSGRVEPLSIEERTITGGDGGSGHGMFQSHNSVESSSSSLDAIIERGSRGFSSTQSTSSEPLLTVGSMGGLMVTRRIN